MTKIRQKILFTATFSVTFIRDDIDLLKKYFSVTAIIAHGWTAPLRYLLPLILSDITFSWFASVYSSFLVFASRIVRKPSIIFLGGVDVAQERDISYGIWNSWWKSIIVRYGIRHATQVVAVDESLKKEAMRLAGYDGKNIITIPFGFNSTQWKCTEQKQHIVLSVGACPDMVRVYKKGFDVLLRVAKELPAIRFVIIGVAEEVQRKLDIPTNVECFDAVPQSELMSYYAKAKVFCQLSLHEGLPNTLCESMLCECIPVGTNVYGIPTAIGDTGFLVEYNNVEQSVQAITQALALPETAGKKARQRIIENFDYQEREKKIVALIEELSR